MPDGNGWCGDVGSGSGLGDGEGEGEGEGEEAERAGACAAEESSSDGMVGYEVERGVMSRR